MEQLKGWSQVFCEKGLKSPQLWQTAVCTANLGYGTWQNSQWGLPFAVLMWAKGVLPSGGTGTTSDASEQNRAVSKPSGMGPTSLFSLPDTVPLCQLTCGAAPSQGPVVSRPGKKAPLCSPFPRMVGEGLWRKNKQTLIHPSLNWG